MRILIAVLTCHKMRARAHAVRETWASCFSATNEGETSQAHADLRFFLGRGPGPQAPDEVLLDVDDGYFSLPAKSRAICCWAAERGYDYLFKCDDDVYVEPRRLLAAVPAGQDYLGRLRGPSGGYPAPYASGFARWLSRRACELVAHSELNGDRAEDRWIGNLLHAAGISCTHDPRYVIARSARNATSFPEGPAAGNQVIAAGEYEPQEMRRLHQMWLSGMPSQVAPAEPLSGEFEPVAVLVKTFLRDGFLYRTLDAVPRVLPGAKIVLVDDGYEAARKISLYAELRRLGHACIWLPFDSGFGAKSNAAIPVLHDRPYTLIASDDFDFWTPGCADGVRRMLAVLDADPQVGVASGRVDNRPYEGFIERGADYFREIRLDPLEHARRATPDGVAYYPVDLTVNYNLVRSSLLGPRRCWWETEYRIGGDHFDFYEQVRAQGFAIAWVPGVNINQQRFQPHLVHPRYGQYRARARAAVPAFLRRHGIRRYIGFDGREDRLP